MKYADLIALRDREDPAPDGVVYFMADDVGGDIYIKIGWSANFLSRVNGYKCDNIGAIPVLLVRGSRSFERHLHRLFGDLRHQREWFRLDGELKDLMSGVDRETWEDGMQAMLIEAWLP